MQKCYFNPRKALGLLKPELCRWPRHARCSYSPLGSVEVTPSLQKADVGNVGLQLGSGNLLGKHFLQNKHKNNKQNPLRLFMSCFSLLVAKMVFSALTCFSQHTHFLAYAF